MNKKIIVFCPNPYSLYTTSVCELLIKRGFSIECIFVRKFTFSRFKNEYARDGKRLLKKIWNKLVLKEKAYSNNLNSIVGFRRENKLSIKNVNQFRDNGTKIIFCKSLNDSIVESFLKKYNEKIIIFTGGGIIKQNILDNAGDGIINCHMGILPRYKGMDLPEWCLLEDRADELGITLHFMDSGIDTGDILKTVNLPFKKFDSIKNLRDCYEPLMVSEMVATVEDFLNGRLNRIQQSILDRRQYFIVHDKLYKIAEMKLKSVKKL